MKLCKLTTAAGVLMILLAASCSKPTNSPTAPSKGKLEPPESAVREYLQSHDLHGLEIGDLRIELVQRSSERSFEVHFKANAVAKEDLVLPVASVEVFDRYKVRWGDVKDVPSFYEVFTAKGTEFANSGKLEADWRIDNWSFATVEFIGKRPVGSPASSIVVESLIIDSPQAKAYFDALK